MFSVPESIAAGMDGALWFTEVLAANRIGRITTAGIITDYYPLPIAYSDPFGIAAGPDGAMWFTEYSRDRLGRVAPASGITEFPLPASGYPYGITAGPDGALWFSEVVGNKIGRSTTAGAITEFPLPTANSNPRGVTAGPDGALWFTENDRLGRISTAGLIDEFPVPSANSDPTTVTTGPDGALWFTEYGGNRIGRAVLPLARPSMLPASGTALSQVFGVRFFDAAGTMNLSVVNVLINSFLDGRSACYLAYVVSTNTLYLVDDAGNAGGPFAGSMVLNGAAGSIENSQCRIDGAGSLANSTGGTLVLTLNATFKAAFAGNRIMHLAQRNLVGFTNGWQRVGVWRVPGAPVGQITVSTLNPARGVATGGIPQPFRLTFTDTLGYTNLGVVNLLINDFIDGRRACYLAYAVGSNTLYLVNDAGDAGGPFAGQMVLNGTGSIENSQCRVIGAGSSAVGSALTLDLTLNVFFKGGFAGNRVLYAAGRDTLEGNNTGWQAVGTWSVQ
jgi:streptogramin lyase